MYMYVFVQASVEIWFPFVWISLLLCLMCDALPLPHQTNEHAKVKSYNYAKAKSR